MICRRIFADTYSKVATANVYDRKPVLTATDLLSDRVLPLYQKQGLKLLRILVDRRTWFCGKLEHEFQLSLTIEEVEPTKTKVQRLQTHGTCERLRKTILNTFYRVAFRQKVYQSLDAPRVDVDT